MPDRFHLTATTVAHFFQHDCDRLFRWEAVPSALRGKAGIGSGVPRGASGRRREGAVKLLEMGERFEADRLAELRARIGERLLVGPTVTQGGRTAPAPIAMDAALAHLAAGPGFVAQPEIALSDAQQRAFRQAAGLPADADVGAVRPDLIEALPARGGVRLRLWDVKASERARHEHFAQVAFYALLLPHALPPGFALDLERAVVWSKAGAEPFEMAPYLRAVGRFLRGRAGALLADDAERAHYHVCTTCSTCAFESACREQAEREVDLSRVPYLPSHAKRRLVEAGVGSQARLAELGALPLRGLGETSHDLKTNAERYQMAARSLGRSTVSPTGRSTFAMPRYEDVRLVVSAEYDAVTGTLFAAGLYAMEGWKEGAPVAREHAFVARAEGDEASVVAGLARAFAGVLRRVDRVNREADEAGSPTADAAQDALDAAVVRLRDFKEAHPRLHGGLPDVDRLRALRSDLEAAVREAQGVLRDAVRADERAARRRQQRLHVYVYDAFEASVLGDALARLRPGWTDAQRADAALLERYFTPPDVLPAPDLLATPGLTRVEAVLRDLLVLPVPYQYDLAATSAALRPLKPDGTSGGYVLRLPPGFGWPGSSQIAFERAHDVWASGGFQPDPDDWTQDVPTGAMADTLEDAVRRKLRAVDSVVRATRQQLGDRLLLRVGPLRLPDARAFDPTLDALHAFVACEAAHQAGQSGRTALLPASDRALRLAGIRGVRPDAHQPDDDALWCTFDPACRDARLDAGDFNLVLSQEGEDLAALVGPPGGGVRGSVRRRMVTLDAIDRQADPPRLCLRGQTLGRLGGELDLSQPLALDAVHTDYTTPRLLGLLDTLRRDPSAAPHARSLLATGEVPGWAPLVGSDLATLLAGEVEALGRAAGSTRAVLNGGQRRAFEGVFGQPLSMVWGPPGTGKTHTLGHLLIGYVLAAARLERPLAIGVTAFTHHAIAGVIRKVAALAARYDVGADRLRVAKVVSRSGHDADDGLPADVERWDQDDVASRLTSLRPLVTIVGATTWGMERAMHADGGAPRAWFDVLLVDEASQLLVPPAAMALAATRPHASVILAGDDLQLPPIVHGTYPEADGALYGSVFAWARAQAETLGLEAERLFLLDENFRMNGPITAYPSAVLYGGRLRSAQPDLRLRLAAAPECPLCRLVFDPERPVVLVRYRAPRPFTSRNELEARLAARLVSVLSDCLARDGAPCPPEVFAADGLAVLAPHRAQNSAIRSALTAAGFDAPGREGARPMPTVDTVDKLQGQERDAVVVSYGVADAAYAAAEGDFLFSRRRFNVAATRARSKLVVLVADDLLEATPPSREVLEEASMLAAFADYCGAGTQLHPWHDPEFGAVELTVAWRGFD